VVLRQFRTIGYSGELWRSVAEREGFEPPIGLHLCRISSAVHSTTLPPLQGAPNRGPKPPRSGRVLGEDGWPDKARNDKSVKSCPIGRAKLCAISPCFLPIGHNPHRSGFRSRRRRNRRALHGNRHNPSRRHRSTCTDSGAPKSPAPPFRLIRNGGSRLSVLTRFLYANRGPSRYPRAGQAFAENGPSGQFKNLSLD
jgi:hypothetical protein